MKRPERSTEQKALESHPDDGFFANEYLAGMDANVLTDPKDAPELAIPAGGPDA